MSEHDDLGQMALRLEQLAIELTDNHDLDSTLEGAIQVAAQLAPCDVASVSLRHGRERFESTVASDPVAERAHELQQEAGEGPCLEASWDEGDVYVVDDVADDRRWPTWGPRGAELGLSSMLAVRLFTTRESVGALNLYSYRPREYDTDDVLAARIVAARVSAALAVARHEENLEQAIDARHRVGLAQGILMERYGLSVDRAFEVLRRYSQDQNRKLRVVAEEIIATRRLPRE